MYDIDFRIKFFINVFCSLCFAFILVMLPLPRLLLWFNPNWAALVLLYWLVEMPILMSMWLVVVVGLLLDVSYNIPLGTNAIIFIAITYIVKKLNNRIGFFFFWQKLLLIFSFIFVYQIYIYLMLLIFDQINNFWMVVPQILMSLLIWPVLSVILNNYRKVVKL